MIKKLVSEKVIFKRIPAKITAVFLSLASTFTTTTYACTGSYSVGIEIQSPAKSNRRLKLVDQSIIDNKYQSTLRQKYLIKDATGITEEEVRRTLSLIFEDTKNTCRIYPLQGAIIFLYSSADTVDGTNWVGRLDTKQMTPIIDVNTHLLPQDAKSVAAADLRCETPNKNKTGKKTIKFDNDVTLPPIKDRTIIGTWTYDKQCTLSFEEVRGNTYEVLRCNDCSGGNIGTKILKKPGGIFRRPSSQYGDYFKILPNGNLGSYDLDGVIDTYIRHTGLWPN